MKVKPKIEPGMKFGKWTILQYAGKSKSRIDEYLCECECGTRRVVRKDNLELRKSTKCVQCKEWKPRVSVVCLETQKQYRSIKEAAANHYISDSALKSAFQRSESGRIAQVAGQTLLRSEVSA